MFQQGQPAAMFFSDDIKDEYERIKARGAEFIMAPTQVPGATIAKLNDTCGNLIQITELDWPRAVERSASPVVRTACFENQIPPAFAKATGDGVFVDERVAAARFDVPVLQYASAETTSPPLRLPSACQVATLIEFLMNWTWPSAIRAWTPPGWLLRVVTLSER